MFFLCCCATTVYTGRSWPRSEVFGPRMFGSALGSADNGFIVADGRFANVSSIYDPDSLLTSTGIEPVHTPYGYISANFDYQVHSEACYAKGMNQPCYC